MVLSKQTYIKKYVGKENKRLTKAYVKRGRIIPNHQTLIVKYTGVSALKSGRDTVGYLIDGKIHSTRTKADRRTKSSQSWEGGSCGSNHDDKKKDCGCGNKKKDCGCGNKKKDCGCGNKNKK